MLLDEGGGIGGAVTCLFLSVRPAAAEAGGARLEAASSRVSTASITSSTSSAALSSSLGTVYTESSQTLHGPVIHTSLGDRLTGYESGKMYGCMNKL